MPVRIVTDSACDLPDAVISDLDIHVVPLKIRFGDDEYVDRTELTTAEFWSKSDASEELPATAAPAPGAFEEAYRSLHAGGAEGIVVVNLSGALSATIEAAEAAARAVDGEIDVQVVDSRSVSMGLGAMVIEAAEMARDGRSTSEIATHIADVAGRTRVIATLDTLENLKKGGRIGAAQSLLGSLLQIKPVIEVKDGAVEPTGRQRTRGKALQFLLDHVREQGTIDRLTVMHAQCADLDLFTQQLATLYDGEIVIGEIGAVIGTHSGPGAIGVTYQVP